KEEGPTELRTPLFLAGERGRVSLVPGKWVAASALASIATYHVRMVNGRAAASGEKKGRSLYPKGRRTQTMASPQAVAAFRVQALERSRGERHAVCFN